MFELSKTFFVVVLIVVMVVFSSDGASILSKFEPNSVYLLFSNKLN